MNDINTPKPVAPGADGLPAVAASTSMPPPDLAGLVHQFRQALHRTGTDTSVAGTPTDVLPERGLTASGFPADGVKVTPQGEAHVLPKAHADTRAPALEREMPAEFRHVARERTDDPVDFTNDRSSSDEPPGAVMLESFNNQRPAITSPTGQSTQQPRVASLEAAVADTVSRVLVSDPLHDGRREIRIELSADVLPQTSIRLWRDEGRLHVEFTAPVFVADEGLRDMLPRLGDAIQQRLNETAPLVSLRTTDTGAGHAGSDGRSRQQYQAFVDDTSEEA